MYQDFHFGHAGTDSIVEWRLWLLARSVGGHLHLSVDGVASNLSATTRPKPSPERIRVTIGVVEKGRDLPCVFVLTFTLSSG